ncbi:hypothetical protein ABIA31_007940 [Catenulispora sp. MAP5-51]|uniref:hypothetical protein n=1 Tax=Catenulispora sp. MAP5-51 TaxID=3156298 RepID=UPI003516816B
MQSSTARFGYQTEQQRGDRAIGPVRPRPPPSRSELAPQDGELLAQQQDLDGLAVLVASAPSKRDNKADGQDVDEA